MTADTPHLSPSEFPDLSDNNSPLPPTPPSSKGPYFHIETDSKSAQSPNHIGANGIHHHDDDDDHDDNANAIPKDDSDGNSYDFVTRNNDSSLPLHKDHHHHLKGIAAPLLSAHPKPIGLQIAKLATETDATEVASSINGFGVLHQEDSMDAFPVGGTTPAASEVAQQNGGGSKADAEPHQLADGQFDSKPPAFVPTQNQQSEVAFFVLESDVDLVEGPDPEIPSLHIANVTKSNVIHQKSVEDSLDSISPLQVKIQELPHTSLESTPSKSPVYEVSKPSSTAQHHLQSFEEINGSQKSQNTRYDSTQCVPQHIEVQKVYLEENIGTDLDNVVEERVECGVPLTITVFTEESVPSEFDKSGQRDEKEEIKRELLSEAKQSHETVIGPGENGQYNLGQGLEDENSANEVDLPSSTATASGPVLNENKDHFPVSSSDGSIPDIKESFEDYSETHSKGCDDYADDHNKPLEMHQTSACAITIVPVTSCVKRETDIVDNPVESVEIVQDSTKEHQFQHDATLTEDAISSDDEVCIPETEDVHNVVAQSIDVIPDISRELETENVACPPSENLMFGADEVIKSETEVVLSVSGNPGSVISSPVSGLRFDNGLVRGENIQSCFSNTTFSGTEFELGISSSNEKTLAFQEDEVHAKTEVGILDVECDTQFISSVSEVKYELENSSGVGGLDMPCSNAVASHTEVSYSTAVISGSVPDLVPETKDDKDQGDQLSVLDMKSDDKLICQENMKKSDRNEISMSLPENSSPDALAGQNVGFGPLVRPFCFLIRMPRFENLQVREQIRLAELQVKEKTKHRDAFRLESQKHKANHDGHAAEYDAAKSKVRAKKMSLKSKRAERDSLLSVMNKVNNAISVEDIDARIHKMERIIQHETQPLKEEKQFIREIKQLKQLREQLSSSIGSQDEVQQAFNEREENEKRLKILKKEMANLKEGILKAEAVAQEAQRKYKDERIKLKELKSQFEAANDIRQAEYHYLLSLKKELYEKNKQFQTYKDTAGAACDYAGSKDRKALHHLCVNQVETIMDLWNKNYQFRKEYVKCNTRSTLRRLGTLDGHSLGPDEDPPALTNYGVERINRLVSNSMNTSPVLQTQILKQENRTKHIEDVCRDDSANVKEVEVKSQPAHSREPVKPIKGDGCATISGRGISDDEINGKEQMPTKEELELARKAEELWKLEAAAKLREQCRLEEKTKALEALERKKRIAEKAQMRAELRAQKEAELREKEREKRLRKKERKKERKKASGAEVPVGDSIAESTPSSESVTETIKESKVKDSSPAVTKRYQKPSIIMKQSKTKSIPPPLRNRGKRKMQQWMWVIFTLGVVLVLLFLGNIGFFSNLSNLRQRSHGF
ncbi:hypothetical protein ACH5RR_027627 [Cinchona calisaya]|uniref:Uncharacterized protein n=1 Tax=Cinchona calisaya TaxID=153742 RepID=A0ABD2Z622_9GENT